MATKRMMVRRFKVENCEFFSRCSPPRNQLRPWAYHVTCPGGSRCWIRPWHLRTDNHLIITTTAITAITTSSIATPSDACRATRGHHRPQRRRPPRRAFPLCQPHPLLSAPPLGLLCHAPRRHQLGQRTDHHLFIHSGRPSLPGPSSNRIYFTKDIKPVIWVPGVPDVNPTELHAESDDEEQDDNDTDAGDVTANLGELSLASQLSARISASRTGAQAANTAVDDVNVWDEGGQPSIPDQPSTEPSLPGGPLLHPLLHKTGATESSSTLPRHSRSKAPRSFT